MKLEYTLTLDDYKAAHTLHYKQKLGRRINFLIFYRVIPLMAIVMSLVSIGAWALGSKHLFASLMPADVGLIWLAIFFPAQRAYAIRKCSKQIFPPVSTDRSISIDIDDDRIISTVPNFSEGKFLWKAIMAFTQDERITLLYIRKTAFLFVPTKAMSPAQRTELTDLVARHVVKR